jgi:hypothetical protein
MSKAQERLAASPSQKMEESSIIDYKQVVEASTTRLRPGQISFANLGKQQSRDSIMYRQDDRWSNVILENTKEARESELKARIIENRKSPCLHRPK